MEREENNSSLHSPLSTMYQLVATKVALHEPFGVLCGHTSEQRINAVKRLAVSTGRLKRLPALHPRPIDLVVFQEPSLVAQQETSS